MKTALLLMALAGAGAGCGGPVDHVEYWADSTIPAEDAAAACEGWASGVGVECARVDSGRANVLITAFSDTGVAGAFTDTWKHPVSIKINVSPRAAGFNMAASIAHEMGHAMGLGHLDGGPALMNTWATVYDLPVLTDVDIAGWRALNKAP